MCMNSHVFILQCLNYNDHRICDLRNIFHLTCLWKECSPQQILVTIKPRTSITHRYELQARDVCTTEIFRRQTRIQDYKKNLNPNTWQANVTRGPNDDQKIRRKVGFTTCTKYNKFDSCILGFLFYIIRFTLSGDHRFRPLVIIMYLRLMLFVVEITLYTLQRVLGQCRVAIHTR